MTKITSVKTLGYEITYHGDPSVGMFRQDWTIRGVFYFQSEAEEDEYIEKIKEAWEYCSDTPVIIAAIARMILTPKMEEAPKSWK